MLATFLLVSSTAFLVVSSKTLPFAAHHVCVTEMNLRTKSHKSPGDHCFKATFLYIIDYCICLRICKRLFSKVRRQLQSVQLGSVSELKDMKAAYFTGAATRWRPSQRLSPDLRTPTCCPGRAFQHLSLFVPACWCSWLALGHTLPGAAVSTFQSHAAGEACENGPVLPSKSQLQKDLQRGEPFHLCSETHPCCWHPVIFYDTDA